MQRRSKNQILSEKRKDKNKKLRGQNVSKKQWKNLKRWAKSQGVLCFTRTRQTREFLSLSANN